MVDHILSDAQDRLRAALEAYWEACEEAGRRPGPELTEIVNDFVRRKVDWYGEGWN